MSRRISRVLGACLLLFVVGRGWGSNPADEELLKENKIAAEGPALLEFFRQRTIQGNDEVRIKALLQKLGDDSFETREQASQQLVALGARARPFLQQATKNTDVEIKHRAEDCLRQIEQGVTSMVISSAVRVLANKKPAGTVEALLAYLPAAEDSSVAEEIRQVFVALAQREGKAEPALVLALTDKEAVKRAAAGSALARANLADQRDSVRKLLADPVSAVRYQVGMALTATRDKEAVAVLIELLADPAATAEEVGTIEDLLYRLAEDKAPTVAPGTDAPSKKKYREAWAGWWKDNSAKIDLAKLGDAARILNHTLVVLLDQGQVVDLDNANKPRFQIGGLEFPLDAQYLPGDRVLVAEHNASRVTERSRDGKILWQKQVDSPLVAQRLPNGNTFIATRTQLVEVDRDNKEVFTHTRPGGEAIMRAQKLRNGDIAMITQAGVSRYVRMNSAGKELSSFGVDVRTSGGRIEVLPNGHVLIPENANNRVVEHDAQGRIVPGGEVTIESPIAAYRLPNGHTLVTSMNPLRGAVELDRAGKEVWTFKSETRVTRAYRR